jgi:hypothetical protein
MNQDRIAVVAGGGPTHQAKGGLERRELAANVVGVFSDRDGTDPFGVRSYDGTDSRDVCTEDNRDLRNRQEDRSC